jgi:hypothetical protein
VLAVLAADREEGHNGQTSVETTTVGTHVLANTARSAAP